MAFQQSSPLVKFEASPAESFLSAPGDNFTSLFADSTPSTLNPRDMMTPDSVADIDSRLSVIPESHDGEDDDSHSTSATAPSSSEKKPVKKRKSWGQVLPEPKTNLPPRYVTATLHSHTHSLHTDGILTSLVQKTRKDGR